MSVDGSCPACKRPLVVHGRSAARADPKPGLIDVVRGRCILADERAPQKICWVTLADVDTPEAYKALLAKGRPVLPSCPACGGTTAPHGSFVRQLALTPQELTDIRLYRARCKEPSCPVVTITLYPPFVLPYRHVPAPVRDAAMRARQKGHAPWRELVRRYGYDVRTLRRWDRRVRGRQGDLKAAFVVLLDRIAPVYRLPTPADALTVWDLVDHYVRALRAPPTLALQFARTVFPAFVAALPVFT